MIPVNAYSCPNQIRKQKIFQRVEKRILIVQVTGMYKNKYFIIDRILFFLLSIFTKV